MNSTYIATMEIMKKKSWEPNFTEVSSNKSLSQEIMSFNIFVER